MSLIAKLCTLGVAGAGIGVPIPFVLRIGCSIPGMHTRWDRWVENFPYLRCQGNKIGINLSLAFKSEWSGIAQNDLYLKGLNTKTGAEVNWDEKLEFGVRGTNKWQLSVVEGGEIEIIDMGEVSMGWGGGGEFKCDLQKIFKVTQTSYGWDYWGEAVADVKFKLASCTQTGSRRECDIEIADSSRLDNKNSSAFLDKLGKSTDDLYLKVWGYVGNEAVNFDEKIIGSGHVNREGEHLWQLKVFESGATGLGELGGADGSDYGEDDIKCDEKPFDVTKWTYGSGDSEYDSWEKPVTDIPYYLVDADKAIRREIFEMKGI